MHLEGKIAGSELKFDADRSELAAFFWFLVGIIVAVLFREPAEEILVRASTGVANALGWSRERVEKTFNWIRNHRGLIGGVLMIGLLILAILIIASIALDPTIASLLVLAVMGALLLAMIIAVIAFGKGPWSVMLTGYAMLVLLLTTVLMLFASGGLGGGIRLLIPLFAIIMFFAFFGIALPKVGNFAHYLYVVIMLFMVSFHIWGVADPGSRQALLAFSNAKAERFASNVWLRVTGTKRNTQAQTVLVPAKIVVQPPVVFVWNQGQPGVTRLDSVAVAKLGFKVGEFVFLERNPATHQLVAPPPVVQAVLRGQPGVAIRPINPALQPSNSTQYWVPDWCVSEQESYDNFRQEIVKASALSPKPQPQPAAAAAGTTATQMVVAAAGVARIPVTNAAGDTIFVEATDEIKIQNKNSFPVFLFLGSTTQCKRVEAEKADSWLIPINFPGKAVVMVETSSSAVAGHTGVIGKKNGKWNQF